MSLRTRVRALSRRFESDHRLRTEAPILAEMRRVADGLREGVIRFLASIVWEELGHVEYAAKIARGTVSLDECRNSIERARALISIEQRREIGVYMKLSARNRNRDRVGDGLAEPRTLLRGTLRPAQHCIGVGVEGEGLGRAGVPKRGQRSLVAY